jgi:phosphohistidine phosphatase
MKLYLVQHAEAKSQEEDPQRPLSEKGQDDIGKVARHVSKYLKDVETIFHSGKLRAQQTAEMLGEHLGPTEGIKKAEGLDPLADPSIWVDKLQKIQKDVMLVGHLPHLARLSSRLICGDETKRVIDFQMGGVICLIRDQAGQWSVRWGVTPEVIK